MKVYEVDIRDNSVKVKTIEIEPSDKWVTWTIKGKNYMEGFRTYRHKDNPLEREFHDEFINRFGNNLHQVGLGVEKSFATEHEEKVIISTIQWLGTPVGQDFLNSIGFYYDFDLQYGDDE